MGKWCLRASSFIFDRIIIKVAGNQDRHKSLDEFDFGPLVSMAHLHVFEMRFDLGTLDSGDRSLPFGLLFIQPILLQETNTVMSCVTLSRSYYAYFSDAHRLFSNKPFSI